MGTKLIALDRVLAHYGPETREARAFLRHHTLTTVLRSWPEDAEHLAGFAPTGALTPMASVAPSAFLESRRLENLRTTSDVLAGIQNILLNGTEQRDQRHDEGFERALGDSPAGDGSGGLMTPDRPCSPDIPLLHSL